MYAFSYLDIEPLREAGSFISAEPSGVCAKGNRHHKLIVIVSKKLYHTLGCCQWLRSSGNHTINVK